MTENPYKTALEAFVKDCRFVCEKLGKDGLMHVQRGSVRVGMVRRYKDDVVEITTELKSEAIDIDMLKPHHNPVIMVNPDGSYLRTHGEWSKLKDHVSRLAILDRLAREA